MRIRMDQFNDGEGLKPFDPVSFKGGEPGGGSPDPTPEPIDPSGEPGGEPAGQAPVKPVETKPPAPIEDNLDDYWKGLKSIVKDYQVPDEIKTGKVGDKDLTPDAKLKILHKELLKHTGYSTNPEVNALIKHMVAASAAKEDFNISDYITEVSSMVKQEPKDVNTTLFEHYKAQYGKKDDKDGFGMTDEQIQAEVDKMSEFNKRGVLKEIQKEQHSKLDSQTQAYQQKYNKDIEERIEVVQKEDKALVESYLLEVKAKNKLDGFDFSEADLNEFVSELPDFFEKKAVKNEQGWYEIQTGIGETLADIMASPEKQMLLAPLLWLAKKGKLSGYTTDVKERMKKREEAKLAGSPGAQGREGQVAGFDREKFMGKK